MQYTYAIIKIRRATLAAILVTVEQTYPTPGANLIAQVQSFFPTLPIILVSPRIGGFSRSFAHFDTTNIINHINADEIDWRPALLSAVTGELPF